LLPHTPRACSYQIRSIPTISGDRIYCKVLAHNAVHAAFAGYTGVTVGLVNTHVSSQGGGRGGPNEMYLVAVQLQRKSGGSRRRHLTRLTLPMRQGCAPAAWLLV
jgi:6-phosphofructokinase